MAEETRDKPPVSVNGITALGFNQWRHHPVTEVVIGFLTARRTSLIENAMGRWLGGEDTIRTPAGEEVRGRVLELQDIIEMQFEALLVYYQDADTQEGKSHDGK